MYYITVLNIIYYIKQTKTLYKIEKTKTSIYWDETNGLIPKAKKVEKGKTFVRMWENKDLPAIGKKVCFLNPPKK